MMGVRKVRSLRGFTSKRVRSSEYPIEVINYGYQRLLQFAQTKNDYVILNISLKKGQNRYFSTFPIQFKLKISMGTEQSQPLKKRNNYELEYYTTITHPLHRKCRIFTSIAMPMSFIMRIQRKTVQSRLFHFFQQIQDLQSPYLFCLYGFRIERGSTCQPCASTPNADNTVQYWQYLNYSLSQHIRERSNRQSNFLQQQIWHIIESVCQTVEILSQFGFVWEVAATLLYITPQGRLRSEWGHLEMNNEHLKYFKSLRLKDELNSQENQHFGSQAETDRGQFTSPQEQWLIRERQRSVRLNLQQSNAYKFGMLLLYVVTLETYRVPVSGLELDGILRKLAHIYHPCILDVLRNTLHPDPTLRWSIQKVKIVCSEFFNHNYELQIRQEQRSELQLLRAQSQVRQSSRHTYQLHNPPQQSQFRKRQPSGMRSQQWKQQSILQKSMIDPRMVQLHQYRRSLLERHH